VTSLIERERADRITSYTGDPGRPGSSPPTSLTRLDALEHSVDPHPAQASTRAVEQQKDLAHAISTMFDMAGTARGAACRWKHAAHRRGAGSARCPVIRSSRRSPAAPISGTHRAHG
jgi:hypothetical protein